MKTPDYLFLAVLILVVAGAVGLYYGLRAEIRATDTASQTATSAEPKPDPIVCHFEQAERMAMSDVDRAFSEIVENLQAGEKR